MAAWTHEQQHRHPRSAAPDRRRRRSRGRAARRRRRCCGPRARARAAGGRAGRHPGGGGGDRCPVDGDVVGPPEPDVPAGGHPHDGAGPRPRSRSRAGPCRARRRRPVAGPGAGGRRVRRRPSRWRRARGRGRGRAVLLTEAKAHDATALRRLGRRLLEVVDPATADRHESEVLGQFTIPTPTAAMLKKGAARLRSAQAPGLGRRPGPRARPPLTPAAGAGTLRAHRDLHRRPAAQTGGANTTVVVTMTLDSLRGGLRAACSTPVSGSAPRPPSAGLPRRTPPLPTPPPPCLRQDRGPGPRGRVPSAEVGRGSGGGMARPFGRDSLQLVPWLPWVCRQGSTGPSRRSQALLGAPQWSGDHRPSALRPSCRPHLLGSNALPRRRQRPHGVRRRPRGRALPGWLLGRRLPA
ncbi:MAG: hypothetical protein AVDCRST_MAG06-2409 [uncultured Nocardioides sp.]|uniref:Uncharacterized protein n=1 Tax=uncultured Nocardioides sp. TaxID=198441 RepID=A0A6J4P4I7_9ACTN|nr:MAG: hypothetical protein AVDCRST_MAG06-2409 [uncultured Nocardioides sp.]